MAYQDVQAEDISAEQYNIGTSCKLLLSILSPFAKDDISSHPSAPAGIGCASRPENRRSAQQTQRLHC